MPRIGYRKLHGYKYQLMEPYTQQTPIRPHETIAIHGRTEAEGDFVRLSTTGELSVAKGYAWDGSSGPTIDTPSTMRASLVHDAFYQLMRKRLVGQDYRAPADALYRDTCLEDGMPRWRAVLHYTVLRLCAANAAKPRDESRPTIYAPREHD